MTMSHHTEPKLHVLHLAGSAVSDFYFNLSMVWLKDVVHPIGVNSYYAIVHPDNQWQLGTSLTTLSEKKPFLDSIAQLPKVDVVVPHMYCFLGMTSYRALFEDLLGIPVVGSSSQCTSLAMNKAQTRSVVAACGVPIAQGQQIQRGDTIDIAPPLIVKPNSEDNSRGLSLVWNQSQIQEALQLGFEFDDSLLVEEYIPGREFRVAVIEQSQQLYVLPMIEYLLPPDNPIRTMHNKLDIQFDGTPSQLPEKPKTKPICPAHATPELFSKIADAAKTAHIALGCRDYSLYDFRVHAETEEPYMLEAGLFWSFSQISMISRMLHADGQNLEEVALTMWHRAAQR